MGPSKIKERNLRQKMLFAAACFGAAGFWAGAAGASCLPQPVSRAECAQFCLTAAAQNAPAVSRAPQHAMENMSGMHMSDPASTLLMREASGTSVNPTSSPMAMRMRALGEWDVNYMADGFITDTQQSGPRGSDKFFSTNVFMISAQHRLGKGAVLLDAMFSLEPATISGREYPELLQTGETAFGKPIENGQHPHNFVMGLGAHYARPLSKNAIFEAYFAPVGDPALGPVAYPHRASAAELPQAPLGHHWEDSTHISYEVATVGLNYKSVRVEASGFHGAEPGENRWAISGGAMDSWSTRLSLSPSPDWVAQVSVGRLTHPEALEPGDIVRTTASLAYSRPMRNSEWSTSFVFGRNHHTAMEHDANAFLLESVFPLKRSDFFTGRWEVVDKDELFAAEPALEAQLTQAAGDKFLVDAYTVGYTHYVSLWAPLKTGIGANFSTYTIPSAIIPFYGAHPFGVNLYLHFIVDAPKK